MKLVFALILGAAMAASDAEAAMRWRWTCEGEGLAAKGTFTTADAPNAEGFYPITAVAGEVNGVAVVGLQPSGTAIPGNEGWPVDNLVRERRPELSAGGFGFALADGSFVNPFFGARFEPPGFLAVISNPKKGQWREPRVTFRAVRTR